MKFIQATALITLGSAAFGVTEILTTGEGPVTLVSKSEDEGALRSHCRASLAGYKVPREVRVLDALPRNPTGKIMRRELSVETVSS